MPYSSFIFESYSLDTKKKQIYLNYSLDGKLKFTETITLPADREITDTGSEDVERALFALHLAGGASYYKTYCPKTIEVKSGKLSSEQAAFWNDFYTKGLGEFFYQNKLDYRGLVNFPVALDRPVELMPLEAKQPNNALVPFGGGKDSQVTVEILKKHNVPITLFRMKGHAFITELAELNELDLLEVDRTLDPQLFELNKQGVMNGHVPVTGYVVFLTTLIALLYGYDATVFSNERSSDYGNVNYLDMEVNHQWSKSNEAEILMRDYLENCVTTNVEYLNLLRPLSELHIAKLFSTMPQYFQHVTSCNQNWLWAKLDEQPSDKRWCGECDKCSFVFAILAAFLPLKTMTDIFGKNMFADEARLHQYRELWGAEEFKPFQCVGTPEETQAALYLATRSADYANTVIGQDFITNVLPTIKDPEQLVKDMLTPDYHDVQPYVANLIKQELAA